MQETERRRESPTSALVNAATASPRGYLTVGTSVLVKCYSDPEGVLWLGRMVAVKDLNFRCSKKCGTNDKAHGAMLNKGGTTVVVQWYERVPGGMERRDFAQGKHASDVFNSTELRLRGFVMEKRGLFYKTAAKTAAAGAVSKVRLIPERVVRPPRADEAKAVFWCR